MSGRSDRDRNGGERAPAFAPTTDVRENAAGYVLLARQRAVSAVADLFTAHKRHVALAIAADVATIALLGRESCSREEVRARIASLLARRLFRGLVLPPSALVVLPYAADKLARVVLERIESNLNAAGAAQQPRGTWNEPTNL